jgi:predicted transposase YbfD/YdcC
VDGKRLRRPFDRASGKAAIHLVSAWASANALAFRPVATAAKGNEITALPGLLKLLDSRGATVTIDAMRCQTAIAGQIVEQGGDYVLDAKLLLDGGIARGFDGPHDYDEDVDKGHGRIEIRRVWATDDIAWFSGKERWPGLRTWAAVECERVVGDQTCVERRHFISSRPPQA